MKREVSSRGKRCRLLLVPSIIMLLAYSQLFGRSDLFTIFVGTMTAAAAFGGVPEVLANNNSNNSTTISSTIRTVINDPQSSQPSNVASNVVSSFDSLITLDTNGIISNTTTSTTESPLPRYHHPHAGARYPNGTWGYLANVTQIRAWILNRWQTEQRQSQDQLLASYLPMTEIERKQICKDLPGHGPEEERGYKILRKVIAINSTNPIGNGTHPRDESSSKDDDDDALKVFNGVSQSRILCAVYTHAGVKERTTVAAETYGWRCDGFFAASTETVVNSSEVGFGSIDLPHLGEESYGNMWQKTRSILSYMHDNYINDFEYFYLAGDDALLLVENLRRYLYDVEQRYNVTSEPLYIGQIIGGAAAVVFNGGGPGYILNRVTLQLVVERLPNKCNPQKIISAEDRFLGKCLASLDIRPIDTADARGQQRFHGAHPIWLHDTTGKSGYFQNVYEYWAKAHGFKAGVALISEQSTAFHYFKSHRFMKRHFAILYNSCSSWSKHQEEEHSNSDSSRADDDEPSLRTSESSHLDTRENSPSITTAIDAPPRDHPHAGARYPNGTWGYRTNVTQVRAWILDRWQAEEQQPQLASYLPMTDTERTQICKDVPGQGPEEERGYKILRKVVMNSTCPIGNGTHPRESRTDEDALEVFDGLSQSRILCAIYTHAGVKERTTVAAETYGWRCDGFFAASTETVVNSSEVGFGSIDLPHLGDESYGNMWQKTRSILAYMHDHYLNEFDYFYLAGDDAVLLVENLRRYLYDVEQRHNVTSEPLYIGQVIGAAATIFNGGGPGYILNRLALQRVVERFPKCDPQKITSAEDRFLARCLASLKIRPMDTADARGQQRFHGAHPIWLHDTTGDNGYFQKVYEYWATDHGFKAGVALISEQSTAFHYFKSHRFMKRHFALLYNGCSWTKV